MIPERAVRRRARLTRIAVPSPFDEPCGETDDLVYGEAQPEPLALTTALRFAISTQYIHDFCSMLSMEDHHQFDNDNDLVVLNTTSSINKTDCLFPLEAQAKINTLQATVNSLSQPRWLSCCHTWAKSNQQSPMTMQSVRVVSRPAYWARISQRQILSCENLQSRTLTTLIRSL